MIKNTMIALTAGTLALFLAGQAQALTLTNRDTVEQRVQITEGGDEAVTHDVVIAANQILDELCKEACTVTLESGAQESFEGDENVYIEDGRFVIAE